MIGKNNKVQKLLLAIAEHEGWHSPSETATPGGSRSYRNHNPGNLRKSPFEIGNVDNFSIFKSDFVGFMALEWDIMQKALGNTVTDLGPHSSLRDLIFVYAPPSDDNDSEAYLQTVANKTGLKSSTTLKEIFDF